MEPNFANKGDFVKYVTESLIPDLRESGNNATADDFEESIYWMTINEQLHKRTIEDLKNTLSQIGADIVEAFSNNESDVDGEIIREQVSCAYDTYKEDKEAYEYYKKLNYYERVELLREAFPKEIYCF